MWNSSDALVCLETELDFNIQSIAEIRIQALVHHLNQLLSLLNRAVLGEIQYFKADRLRKGRLTHDG